ncbi:MAG: maleylpyruvate isomerase N-terminal domain-containing protein [Vicinamibacteria bacterium]
MTTEPAPLAPILVAHLVPEIEGHLLELLRALRPDEWRLQTLAPAWTVKDVTAHLLDTQLRRLALCRDGHVPPGAPPRSPAEVSALVNRLNAEGVAYFARLSPDVLIAMMEVASRASAAYLQSLDPLAPAAFGVSWAGEDTSANWFDVARELTERWHHQQQIREATGRPGILTPRFYGPVLDCFMRGLPHAYRAVDAPAGDTVRFDVTGDCGGSWWLHRTADGWRLVGSEHGRLAARTQLPQEIAWRIFTKGIGRAEARSQVTIEGDTALGAHVLEMIAIVA